MFVDENLSLEGEIWKPITWEGGKYSNDYKVSNFGRVWKRPNIDKRGIVRNERILENKVERDGHITVFLTKPNEHSQRAYVHTLVAMEFCQNDNPEKNKSIRHIDGNISNCCASNLEWIVSTKKRRKKKGVVNANSKPVCLIYPETGEIQGYYPSIKSAAEKLGVNLSSVRVMMHNKCKTIHGLIWKYVDKKELAMEKNAESVKTPNNEIWKPVTSYNGIYADVYKVSNLGNVVRLIKSGDEIKERVMKQSSGLGRHLVVTLVRETRRGKNKKQVRVHNLVAHEFCPNDDPKKIYVYHKDGDIKNCRADNLEWVTNSFVTKKNPSSAEPKKSVVKENPKRDIKKLNVISDNLNAKSFREIIEKNIAEKREKIGPDYLDRILKSILKHLEDGETSYKFDIALSDIFSKDELSILFSKEIREFITSSLNEREIHGQMVKGYGGELNPAVLNINLES